jgi:TPR repeat protein
MGCKRSDEGDYIGAFEYYTKAAELGDAEAHYGLSVIYRLGRGVEKDKKKEVYHLEEAAIGGFVDARHNLDVMSTETVGWKGQSNISSSPPTWDTKVRRKHRGSVMRGDRSRKTI